MEDDELPEESDIPESSELIGISMFAGWRGVVDLVGEEWRGTRGLCFYAHPVFKAKLVQSDWHCDHEVWLCLTPEKAPVEFRLRQSAGCLRLSMTMGKDPVANRKSARRGNGSLSGLVHKGPG
jgi:hypothetical protein